MKERLDLAVNKTCNGVDPSNVEASIMGHEEDSAAQSTPVPCVLYSHGSSVSCTFPWRMTFCSYIAARIFAPAAVVFGLGETGVFSFTVDFGL